MVTQTTQHPVRWKAHDKTHQNYIFFLKKKFSKKNFKKILFLKKKVFFTILKKKLGKFFFKKTQKKILKKNLKKIFWKKKNSVVLTLASAQEGLSLPFPLARRPLEAGL